MRAAIHKAGSQIKESSELKAALAESKSEKTATGKVSPAKVRVVISKFEESLKTAARTVGAQKASAAAGKQGAKLWLKGVQKLSTGFAALRVAVEDKEKKNKSASREEALTLPLMSWRAPKTSCTRISFGKSRQNSHEQLSGRSRKVVRDRFFNALNRESDSSATEQSERSYLGPTPPGGSLIAWVDARARQGICGFGSGRER